MLSVLRFLIRIADYTQRNSSEWCGMVVTDSHNLLDCFGSKAKSADECYGSDVLDLDVLVPEWDQLIEIKYALLRMPCVSLKYVKGHQDRQNNYNGLLPLDAQLNIDGDDLAGQYQNAH